MFTEAVHIKFCTKSLTTFDFLSKLKTKSFFNNRTLFYRITIKIFDVRNEFCVLFELSFNNLKKNIYACSPVQM